VLCHCWFGDRRGVQCLKNLYHLSLKVLLRKKWRKKTEVEPSDSGSSVKQWCVRGVHVCVRGWMCVCVFVSRSLAN